MTGLHQKSAGRLAAWAAIMAAAMGTGGCAGLAGGTDSSSDCIMSRNIRSFEGLDDQNLIIEGPGSRAYHVVLVTPSTNLTHEYRIGVLDAATGVISPDGRICNYGGDAIIIDGPIVETIPIRSIELIDATELEALEIQFGIIESADDLVTGTVIE